MAGVRVHELAKELNLTSQETIALLGKVGIRASTHLSLIDEHRARIVKGVLTGDLAEGAKRVKAAPKRQPTGGNGAAAAQAHAATPVIEPPAAPAKPAPPKVEEEPVARLRPVPAIQPKAPRPAPHPPAQPKVVPAASADPTAPIPALRQVQASAVAPSRPQPRPGAPMRPGAVGRGPAGPRTGFARPGQGPGRPGGPGRGIVAPGPMPSAPPRQ